MDRKIVYAGAIPLETDLLGASKNTYMALSKLAATIFGSGTQVVNGLACTPSGVGGLYVSIAPGEIYSLQNVDNSAYSSIPADTAHQIVKQGIMLDAQNLACPAPGASGTSVNYLVQAAFSEQDDTPLALPYFNSANTAQAFNGPNNTGATQNTRRANSCVVSVKAGSAAATGTQSTPAPDAGSVGLWVVTVAYGQTGITSGNIAKYAGAPMIPAGGFAGAFQSHSFEYADDVGTVNAYAVNVAIPPAAYADGMGVSFSTANANTSATPTMNVNGLGPVVIAAPGGGTLAPGQIPANVVKEVRYNAAGPRFELQDGMANMTPGFPYADATGTADAIAAAYAIPSFGGLSDGFDLTVGIAAPNATAMPTFAPTINGVAQTARTVVKFVGNAEVALAAGDLQGDAWLKYDGPNTKWVLQNPANPVLSQLMSRNVVVNGSCAVAQVNGTTLLTLASGYSYPIDNCAYYSTQASKLQAQQVSNVLNSLGAMNALTWGVLSSFTPAATDYFIQAIPIEGVNFARFQYGTANAKVGSLQFKARASVAGTYSGSIRNYAANRSYPFSFVLAANTDTLVKIENISGDTGGTWVGATNAGAALIEFDLGSGSNYKSSAGSWQAGNYVGVTGTTNLVSQVNGSTLTVTDVQFELGSVCTQFERKLYDQELRECQRYLPCFNSAGANNDVGLWGTNSTSGGSIVYIFKVASRVPPTGIVTTTVSGFTATTPTALSTVTAITFTRASNECALLGITGTGTPYTAGQPLLLTAGSGSQIYFTGAQI